MENSAVIDARTTDAVMKMETHYMFRPLKQIKKLFCKMFFIDFAMCTLLSFHILWVPMIPIWGRCIYRQYVRIMYLKKFNMSVVKVLIFILSVLSLEFVASFYLRKLLWLIITNL